MHYCMGCKVYLCNLCWISFHSDEITELPRCTERKLGLATWMLLCFDVNQPTPRSPARALIHTRHGADSSREGMAAQLTGERIQQCAAGVPNSVTVITTRCVLPESLVKRLRQIEGQVVTIRSVLAVWKPAKVAGKKRNTSNRTGATRAMVDVSCGRRATGENRFRFSAGHC